MPTTTDIRTIPLHRLDAWDGNVRKTPGSKTALKELAASIAAHGVLQSLVVRPAKRDRFAVIAGGRRLRALQALAEAGTIAADYPVPCQVLPVAADGAEASLAENTVREAMHPADAFEAFRALAETGVPIADIAARFGVAESVVEKRLRLARVSPAILEAYRRDDLTLECVMAFAVTDDQAAQEALWRELPDHCRHAHAIRRALTERDVAATDRRVRFVTLKAYEKAGGTTRRDLFTDGAGGVFVLDAPLLERLVAAKLERAAAKVRKEGWRWVEIVPEFGYDARAKFKRVHEEPAPLSAKQERQLDRLQVDEAAIWNESADGDLNAEQSARLDALQEQVDAINAARPLLWPDGAFEMAGAVVTLGHGGKADIHRGLVRPEDAKKRSASSGQTQNAEGAPISPGLPAKLVETLSAHRSAALSAALIDRPPVALAVVVHALAAPLFTGSFRGAATCLQLSLTEPSRHRVEGSPAFERIAQVRAQWAERLPGTPEALWTWCLEQHRDVLIDLLAYCAAVSIDAVISTRGSTGSGPCLAHAGELALELNLDMSRWFTPTAENYFSRVSKAQILEALQAAKGEIAPAWTKAKKSELAAIAERTVVGTGWLPALLRPADESVSTEAA